MIPDTQMATLQLDINRAIAHATRGYLVVGYDCLLSGLHRAEAAQHDGEPWAAELAGRYRRALETYTHTYGVKIA